MEGTGEVRRGGGWNWSSVDLEAEKKKKSTHLRTYMQVIQCGWR